MSKRMKVQCERCRKSVSVTKAGRDLWNVTVQQGVVIGHLCPTCQTPEEFTEAEINHSTTRYGVDSFGRLIGFAKEEVDA